LEVDVTQWRSVEQAEEPRSEAGGFAMEERDEEGMDQLLGKRANRSPQLLLFLLLSIFCIPVKLSSKKPISIISNDLLINSVKYPI
jgi:hypothetical protein